MMSIAFEKVSKEIRVLPMNIIRRWLSKARNMSGVM